jgi:predicted RNA-binding Zn-ribbon protein involved in translation (DUF1610 family)
VTNDGVVSVEKVAVEGSCPECGKEALKRYPILGEGGWFDVVKCQDCLCSVSRDRWHRLGYVERLEDRL